MHTKLISYSEFESYAFVTQPLNKCSATLPYRQSRQLCYHLAGQQVIIKLVKNKQSRQLSNHPAGQKVIS